MTTQVKLIIGALGFAVVVLTVALGVSLASGHDDDTNGMMGNGRGGTMNASNDGYMGMMQAMGRMDSNQMLTMMRSVLGEDGYQRMLQHLADHRSGTSSTYDNTPAGMMHQMMDGMMQRMPDDTNHLMPMNH